MAPKSNASILENTNTRMYIKSSCIASTIRATTGGGRRNTAMFSDIGTALRYCYTSNNTYGVVVETNTSVMENNDTQMCR